jgi:hypothetical protein
VGRTVERRHGGTAVLAIAALGMVLAGAAACGGDSDTVESAPLTATATATPSETVTPPATDPTAEAAAGPIVVEQPAQGATVARTFTVSGTSQTTEGTVLWQLLRGEEAVAGDVADGGSDAPAAFSFEVTAPAAGKYTLRVFSESAKDGAAINVVERTLTVE